MKLTKTVVDAARYEGGAAGVGFRRYVLWDDAVRGFGLRIFPSGRKVFVLFYRAKGRQRLLTLSSYGVLTVDEARRKARRLLRAVEDGEDPVAARREERRAPTLAAFAERYLDQHARAKKKPSSAAGDERLLRRHILPRLGQRRVPDIDRADITQLHYELRGTPVLANRVLALLRGLPEPGALQGQPIGGDQAHEPPRLIEDLAGERHGRDPAAAALKQKREDLGVGEGAAPGGQDARAGVFVRRHLPDQHGPPSSLLGLATSVTTQTLAASLRRYAVRMWSGRSGCGRGLWPPSKENPRRTALLRAGRPEFSP